ncbi:MAG: hypothetical protein LBK53_00410 [Heliobacteriaceae bacterium]|jgi:hypothetical protein|nr:hypothetical protein [Heliobacteriaceae bacterium]
MNFKTSVFKNYGENPGKMLVHTGTLGWILSSMAQVGAVVFNDKIEPEQKSFLIPQEIADAAVNILSFYLITNTMKRFASKMVSTGKWTTPKIKEAVSKITGLKGKLGHFDTKLGDCKEIAGVYKPFKNDVEVVASTAGAIISSNLVTPLGRNEYAARRQKSALARMHNNNELTSPKGISLDAYRHNAEVKFSGGLRI